MHGFCANCGTALNRGARFCQKCGTPTPPDPVTAGSPASLAGISEPPPAANRTVLFALLGFFGVALAVALGLWLSRDATGGIDPVAVASSDAAIDPNAPRPQEWFDNYTDKFLSAEIERIATSAAQKRNFPTAKGSQVSETLPRGSVVSGRWVEGGDPATKWLKTRDGGYIWEGNLGDPQAISSLGMAGFQAGTSFGSVRGRLDSAGRYSSQDYSWDVQACEIYESTDQLVSVMVIDGKVSRIETTSERLETGDGLRVGSTEKQLTKAYGNKLKKQENPYSGVDYFYWASKDRGIKFHVDDGKVTDITAGDSSISYVEGCL